MSELRIVTNNVPRDLLSWEDLTTKEQKDMDWYDPEYGGLDFFRYRGNAYALSEFMKFTGNYDTAFSSWDGYHSDSYFSGILVRYTDDFERVIVGSYYS